jgi:type II secretory pathway component PulF
MFLLERLEMYLCAGLAIDQCFVATAEGMKKDKKESLEMARATIENGGSISFALQEHIRIPMTTTSLIRHGELSGELAKALSMSRALIEREDELMKKCLSAMAYPVIIGIFAGLLTLGLLRGVMPQIIPMLKNLNVELPLLTRIVMAVSEGFLSYGLYAAGGIACVLITFIWMYKRFLALKKVVHIILMKIPIVGNMVTAYHLSLFLRSVGALVESGLAAAHAYKSVAETVHLVPLRAMFESQVPEIQRGVSLGTVLKHPYIPEYVAPLVSAGERSGSLGSSLGRAATVLDRDIEHALKRMTALIEPVMMAGMGCIVGAIALSIMMPIYDISKVLQK